jgi:hypothetical protein
MSIEDIYLHYDIIGINGEPTSSLNNIYTKTTITRLNRQREKTVKKCKEYIDTMILNRDQLVTRVKKTETITWLEFRWRPVYNHQHTGSVEPDQRVLHRHYADGSV